jgi:hypothetical protein
MATFTGLMIDTAASYTLQAGSGSLADGVSSLLTVTPGTATHLVVATQPPASVNASAPFGLTIEAEDAYGNVATNFTGAIALTLSGTGTLSGTASLPASTGVATFSGLSISKPGSGDVLKASAAGLTATQTGTFTVAANQTDQLVVTTEPPQGVTAGSTFTVVVKVESGGHVDTDFSGPITLALNGPGGLLGTTTVTARNGIATFTGLRIDTASSSDTIEANSVGLNAVPTTGFAVAAGTVTHLVITTPPPGSVPAGAGAGSFGLVVSAEDAYGNVNPTFTGTISLTLSHDPTRALLNGSISMPATAGIATFTGLSINTAASGYVLTASSGKMAASTGSLTVTPGAAVKLVITAPPASVKAGTAFTFTVEAVDQYGNVAPTFNGLVNLALANNPGNALLHGAIVVRASAGVAVFSGLAINTAGTGYTLTASTFNLTSATSKGLTITPAAAKQLAVTVQPPSSVKAGTGFALTVVAEDAFGNVVTNFTGSISLTLSGGAKGAKLAGTSSMVAKAGVAAFQGLKINLAAMGYRLKVKAAGLSVTSTNAFDVTV